jgi:cysteine desulfurase family protein
MTVLMPARIYLDNAATTWPKPETVYAAVENAMRANGAAAGRGVFANSSQSSQILSKARLAVAKLINAVDSSSVVFTHSGTDSLSTAILGLLQPGDHVVTTEAEHNSVLRPLKHLEATDQIRLSIVECDQVGLVNPENILNAVNKNTRLLAMTHVSNVTGVVQSVQDIFGSAKNKSPQVITLLDAAQSLGNLPIDVDELACDILAAPGHKGLYGPLGTGVLYLQPKVVDQVRPLRYGGTGVSSGKITQPISMPEKFEAGNLNVPAIAGLLAGVEFLQSEQGIEYKADFVRCSEHLHDRLQAMAGLERQVPDSVDHRIGIYSVSIPGFDSHEIASLLDVTAEVQVRSGLHCAPLIHNRMGTAATGGTIRLSVSGFNTIEQIDTACATIEALKEMSESI